VLKRRPEPQPGRRPIACGDQIRRARPCAAPTACRIRDRQTVTSTAVLGLMPRAKTSGQCLHDTEMIEIGSPPSCLSAFPRASGRLRGGKWGSLARVARAVGLRIRGWEVVQQRPVGHFSRAGLFCGSACAPLALPRHQADLSVWILALGRQQCQHCVKCRGCIFHRPMHGYLIDTSSKL
jgi:hypothetical protein